MANKVMCACLLDQQVLHQVGNNDDINTVYCIMQEANNNAIHALLWAGYNAQFLQATYKPKANEYVAVTAPHTHERQLALMNAKGHGGVYHVIKGGRNITENDFFVAVELKAHKAERVEVQKRTKEAQKMEALEVKALRILLNMEGKTINELHVDNFNALLGWHGVATGMLKNKWEKVAQWQGIVASMMQPPSFVRWTNEDKAQLLSVMSDDVNIMDMQCGCLAALQARELEATL
jgi:hypothetical protein